MTPAQIKKDIIGKKYFIGWEIGMFLKVIYPKLLPVRPKRGCSVQLPGGCEVSRTNQGKWFLISHTPNDIDEVCEELSKMTSLGSDVDICHQNKNSPDSAIQIAPGIIKIPRNI